MSRPAEKVEPIDYTVLAIRQLTAELPMNDFGLPTGIYRTDLLPFHDYIPPGSYQDSEDDDSGAVVEPSQVKPVDLSGAESTDSAADPTFTQMEADPFALMSGQGDGLPDVVVPRVRQEFTKSKAVATRDYRIAGFPAKALQAAFVSLQYDEGFPAFEDGRTFWSKLDYEPNDAFMAFNRYLQMNMGRVADPEDEEDYGVAASGTRAISTLVQMMTPGISDKMLIQRIEQLKMYSHLYYWGLRTKSYDLFRVVQYRQQQEIRAIETQDDHFIQARKLRNKVMNYMESEEDFWDLMTPKVAVDLLKTTTQLERISAGIPAAGPSVKEGDGSSGRSFEISYRTIAQDQAGDSGSDTALIDQEGHVLDAALESPEATKILQELIIKGN